MFMKWRLLRTGDEGRCYILRVSSEVGILPIRLVNSRLPVFLKILFLSGYKNYMIKLDSVCLQSTETGLTHLAELERYYCILQTHLSSGHPKVTNALSCSHAVVWSDFDTPGWAGTACHRNPVSYVLFLISLLSWYTEIMKYPWRIELAVN